MHSYVSKTYGFKLYSDSNGLLLPLPSFYSEFISTHHQDYHLTKINDSYESIEEYKLAPRNISEKLLEINLAKLSNFLEWVEDYSKSSQYVSLGMHHNIPDKIINYYLNQHLIEVECKGEKSSSQHLSSLISYYNYLEFTGFSNRKILYIDPKLKEVARMNTKRRTAIKYLTPSVRQTFINFASTKRDVLLIMTSSECGLRSKENQGFLLKDFNAGGKKYKGLETLFRELEEDENKLEFIYFLQGIYSKGSNGEGGKSREIFLSRSILEEMRDYWIEERPSSDSNHLFLNDSNNNKNPISKSRASDVFRAIRKRIIEAQSNGDFSEHEQEVESEHTYHCLRHSFGTDLFYRLTEEDGILVDNVTTTSQIYLTVAATLGHSAEGRYAPQATKNYIRSCHYKDLFTKLAA
jgi:integrase